MLASKGLEAQGGHIVDASFVESPRQRNTRDESSQIKKGEIPSSFTDNKHKHSQKDTDARWVKKNEERHFGYKNHISIDVKYKFVRNYEVTT
jgi:IS5 family transposase